MTDPTNPFEAMLKSSQDWMRQANPMLEKFSPKGYEALWPTMPKDMMEMFMGKGISPEGLDAKTRLLLTLMGLTIMGAQAEAQVRLTVRHVREAGATRQEIAETIAQAGMYGGMPSMSKAMELANAVMQEDEPE